MSEEKTNSEEKGEEKTQEKSEEKKGFLTTLKGKLTAAAAVVTALVALLGGMEKLGDIVSPYLGGEADKTKDSVKADPRECLQAEVRYPSSIALSEWDSMRLYLTGNNECRESLGVHISFKAANAKVRIEPPFADCLDVARSDCWETHSPLERGELERLITPPRLRPFSVPLGDPVRLRINWGVYNVETQRLLHSKTSQIQLLDG